MDELIYEYDNVLIGRFESLSIECFIGIEAGGHNEFLALGCIRYALEKIMAWDEVTAIQRFDSYMIHMLRLEPLLRFIDFPPDVEFGNPRYILSRLYPNKVKLNQKQMSIDTMESIISGDRNQFPRDYFVGVDGFKRYCYCLQYLLEVYEPFSSIEDLYNYFASSKGNVFLAKYKLKIPTYQYKLDIFEALRTITRHDPDGELYYNFYLFNKEFNSTK